jgi:hypothetical protein
LVWLRFAFEFNFVRNINLGSTQRNRTTAQLSRNLLKAIRSLGSRNAHPNFVMGHGALS